MEKLLSLLGLLSPILVGELLSALFYIALGYFRFYKRKIKEQTSALNRLLSKEPRVMDKIPFKRLPNHIQRVVMTTLVHAGYVTRLPEMVSVKGDKTWMYYIKPKNFCTSFLLELDIKDTAAAAKLNMGQYQGQYAEQLVDRDKTKRPLEKNKLILKGVLDGTTGTNVISEMEFTFHHSQMPKTYSEVPMNERERRIMYCFGVLKAGYERREALSRLSVSDSEISDLITKGLLKMTNSGPAMTLVGEVNRLPFTAKLIPDQW